MTDPPQFYIAKPIFEGAKNSVIECKLCGWHFGGPRPDLKEAWNEHYRMHHSQEVGEAHIHRQPREELWLPLSARR